MRYDADGGTGGRRRDAPIARHRRLAHRADTERLLDACQFLLEQRAAIAAVLGQLGGRGVSSEVGAQRAGADRRGQREPDAPLSGIRRSVIWVACRHLAPHEAGLGPRRGQHVIDHVHGCVGGRDVPASRHRRTTVDDQCTVLIGGEPELPALNGCDTARLGQVGRAQRLPGHNVVGEDARQQLGIGEDRVEVDGGTSANASLLGAKIVNGPSPFNVSTRPAA